MKFDESYVKVANEYKNILNPFVKIGSTYRKITHTYEKKQGKWELINVLKQEVASGIISMWSGLVTEIPEGWVLCDGTNGTPDLRGRFVMGSGGNNGAGGSNTHGHTLTYSGSHTHGDTPKHNPHIHGVGSRTSGGYLAGYNDQTSDCSYNCYTTRDYKRYDNSYSTPGAHYHSVSSGGSHNHSGLNEIEVEPPFYTLAFIMKV